MNKFFKNYLITLTVLYSTTLIAQTGQSSTGNSDAKPVVSSSSADIKNSSDKAQSQNKKSQQVSQIIGVANMGLGAMHMSKFAASCSGGATCDYSELAMGILHLAMGAQSFQQAGANGSAARMAGLTGYETSSTNPFGDPGAEQGISSLPDADSNLSNLVDTSKYGSIKKALTSKDGLNGVKMDPNTGVITTADGKTYDPNSLTDKNALQKAGFGNSEIDAALAANDKIEKAAVKKVGGTVGIGAATAANGYSDGGASSMNYSDSNALENNDGSSGLGKYGNGLRDPASTGSKVAGLTKNFNGEKIGVAAENIFAMMTRRYKTKEKQDSFFDPSELVPIHQ
ncbi:MAG: hypothetical protein KDD45_06210 [Bdellovibrionales bacterium]|nr:hypothetical protein [Bdellovibrionales bacterium]